MSGVRDRQWWDRREAWARQEAEAGARQADREAADRDKVRGARSERTTTVIDSHSQRLLQDILRRESRSVLMYVAEAYPWTTSTQTKTLTSLQQLIAAEREAVSCLGRFLVRQRVPLPFLPSYPAHFTTINFLALDFILPRLIQHQRHSIAELERDLAFVKDPAAQAELERLLALKRQHLPQLEELASPQPQASVI